MDADNEAEAEDTSDKEVFLNGESSPGHEDRATAEGDPGAARPQNRASAREAKLTPALSARDFHSLALGSPGAGRNGASAVDLLLGSLQPCVPHHDPRAYAANAARTKSVPGFSALAFPDLWGHLPPQGMEPMAVRKPNVQRYPPPRTLKYP